MSRRKHFEESFCDTLRTLKIPSKLDKIIEKVPKPKCAIPNFGLPKWKVMPLDSKLPSIPAPENTYYFSRKKIGQGLYTESKEAGFDLNDPHNYEIAFDYNPLHDKHLADYFSKKHITKYLLSRGFTTENSDALCSVKEYNMYRKYLHKLFVESLKKELKYRSELRTDKKVLEKAEVAAKKDTKKAKIYEQRLATKLKIFKDLLHQEKVKRRKQKIKAAKDRKRLKKIQANKKEHLKQIILKSKIHTENVKRKRTILIQKRKNKLTELLIKQAKKEKFRNQMIQKKKFQEIAKKQRHLQESWQRKLQFQRQQIAMEKFFIELVAKQKQIWINDYNEKMCNENINKATSRIKGNKKQQNHQKIMNVKKKKQKKLKTNKILSEERKLKPIKKKSSLRI